MLDGGRAAKTVLGMKRWTGHDPNQLMLFDDDFLLAAGELAEQAGVVGLSSSVVAPVMIAAGQAKEGGRRASSLASACPSVHQRESADVHFTAAAPNNARTGWDGLRRLTVSRCRQTWHAPDERRERPVVIPLRRHDVAHLMPPSWWSSPAMSATAVDRCGPCVGKPEDEIHGSRDSGQHFRAVVAINVCCDGVRTAVLAHGIAP